MAEETALYSSEIVEHSRSPRNFHAPHGAGFQALEHNALCGESISVCAQVEDGVIRELSFQGAGCAFAMASASMMTVALKGKSVEDAPSLFGKLQGLLNGSDGDPAGLGELAAFAAVRERPSRIPCVLLPWTALLNALPTGPAPEADEQRGAAPVEARSQESDGNHARRVERGSEGIRRTGNVIRLLWLSDSPTCPTGMGTVTRQILKGLSAGGRFEILCRGWGYRDEAYDPGEFPYEIRSATQSNADAGAMEAAIAEFRPDVLVTLADIWTLNWLTVVPSLRDVRWIGYYPLDAGPLMRSCRPVLERTDVPVACSEHGRRLLQEAAPGRPIEMIYHGVDTRVFRPLAGAANEEKGEGEFEHPTQQEFVVGFVGRNQPRKQIPTLIKAFARFAEGKADAFLYLHTAPRDAGWDLPELIDRYGLRDRSTISLRATAAQGIPDAEMNEIYNSFDVFVLPSSGEGFGLPTLEAMAAGVPVVVTDSTASRELAFGRGERIRVGMWITSCLGNVEVAYPDEDHLVEILEKLYRDPKLRSDYRRLGREFAETLDWSCIVMQWEALFDRVALAPRRRDPREWK